MPPPRPPHLPRLLKRLQRLEGPLIQVWGWPGTGKRALLEALAGAEGSAVRWVEDEDLASGLESAEGVRWLLLADAAGAGEGTPRPEHAALARLRPHQRLVVAGRRRRPGLAADLLGPGELGLTPREVSDLFAPEQGPAETLAGATDGWLEPLLRLAAEGLPAEPSPAALALVPGVSAFLRHQVFEPLSSGLRDLLLEAAVGEDLEADLWRQVWGEGDARLERLGRLLTEEGLWVEEGGRRRLPHLLRSWLLAEGRRSRSPARRAAAGRLALAAYGQGRLAQALSALTAAGDDPRVTRLLEGEWLEVFATVPAQIVEAALRRSAPGAGGGVELLAAATAALGEGSPGGEEGPLHRLQELGRREGADPRQSAAAALAAAALLAPSEIPADLVPGARRAIGRAAVPGAVEDLLRLLEGEAPAARPAPAGGVSLAQRLLAEAWRRRGSAASTQAPLGPVADGPVTARRRFRVSLLGTPEVVGEGPGGRKEVRWSLRRALKLFACLASSPSLAATRESLVEAAWPEAREEVVERNFHPTLSHLRKSLAAAGDPRLSPLRFRKGVYRLNPEIDWRIDVVELQLRFAEGRSRLAAGDRLGAVDAWRSAWRLYRGPFLEGFYDSWVVERREGLARAYLDGLRQLGDLLFEDGDLTGALDAYRSVLTADLLQEQVHLALMRIYARHGRRDLVRRQYDRLSRLLQEELGVEPLEETTEVFHRLMG